MTDNIPSGDPIERIKALTQDSTLVEIGAAFRTLNDIKDPYKALETVKEAYGKYQFSKEDYFDNPRGQEIESRYAYARRSAVLSIMDYIKLPENNKIKKEANQFLFECLCDVNDPDDSVSQPIFKEAHSRFNVEQLIECYNKFKQPEEKNPQYDLSRTARYATRRRSVIIAFDTKSSSADAEGKTKILEFIDGVLNKNKDPEIYVQEAAVDVFGNPKNIKYITEEHIETLEKIVATNQFPIHLKADKVISAVTKKAGEFKEKSNEEISHLEKTIEILQRQIDNLKKE